MYLMWMKVNFSTVEKEPKTVVGLKRKIQVAASRERAVDTIEVSCASAAGQLRQELQFANSVFKHCCKLLFQKSCLLSFLLVVKWITHYQLT